MADLQANLVILISEFSDKAERRLYKEGGELLDRSLNRVVFETSLLELNLRVLDELCERPSNVIVAGSYTSSQGWC